MKHVFYTLLLTLSLGLGSAMAQDPTPVEYSERVPTENVSPQTLQARAASWVQTKFAYGPKTDIVTSSADGTVQVRGTVKLKPVSPSGKPLERTARFQFIFRAGENTYTYSVGAFMVIPDPEKPEETIPLDQYISQLREEKNLDKTKNDKRVMAQANALASEIAMTFRSYMNTIPATEDGTVGLPAASDKEYDICSYIIRHGSFLQKLPCFFIEGDA